METDKYYRASEIITYPNRRGLLPFSETHFYRLADSAYQGPLCQARNRRRELKPG